MIAVAKRLIILRAEALLMFLATSDCRLYRRQLIVANKPLCSSHNLNFDCGKIRHDGLVAMVPDMELNVPLLNLRASFADTTILGDCNFQFWCFATKQVFSLVVLCVFLTGRN